MGKIDSFLVDMKSHVKNANIGKDIIIERLLKDGIIDQEVANDYMEKYQIVIVKKTWFKKWMDKFSDNKEDFYVYKLIKFEY